VPTSAAWDVHEAPVSSCFKIRVGAFEWTHTMRATDDTELHTRVQAFVPTFREVVAALDALQAERDAAKAAPAVPAPPPAAPAALPQADLQALVQQAVQQALAANGQATPPPQAPPANGQAQAAPPPEGWCALHQVPMELRSNERGSWWSHRLADGAYCKGKERRRRRWALAQRPSLGRAHQMLRITRYGTTRFWALWDGNDLVAVVVYKKGAAELLRRLAAQAPAATEAAAQAAAVEVAARQAQALAAQARALARQAQAAAQAVRARAQPACEAGAAGG
jgi:hypothetical protein